MGEWISVNDRRPNEAVLAINNEQKSYGYHESIIGYIFDDPTSDTGYSCENDHEILCNVTHWMPLPEPPKEET